MEKTLHYTVSGNKQNPSIIFLHGFLGTSHDWNSITPRFNEHCCICIDLPGHGKSLSTDWLEHYTINDISRAIQTIVKNEGLQNITLCGYSMGGRIALNTVIHYPELFQKMILESTSPGIENPNERKIRLLNDQTWANAFYNDTKPSIQNWYQQELFKSLHSHPNFPKLLDIRQTQNPTGIKHAMLSLSPGSQPPLWDTCKNIQVPTILICGELDLKYKAIFNRLEQKIQNTQQYTIQDVGHNTHFESPIQFTKILKEVLTV